MMIAFILLSVILIVSALYLINSVIVCREELDYIERENQARREKDIELRLCIRDQQKLIRQLVEIVAIERGYTITHRKKDATVYVHYDRHSIAHSTADLLGKIIKQAYQTRIEEKK